MRRVPSRLPIPVRRERSPVLALAAGLAIMPGPASAGPFDGFFPSGGPFRPEPKRHPHRSTDAARRSSISFTADMASRGSSSCARCRRSTRSMRSTGVGHGYATRSMHSMASCWNAPCLAPDEAPVPLPPGSIPMARAPRPGAPVYSEPPSAELYDPEIAPKTYPRTPAQPSRERQVRRPDASPPPKAAVPQPGPQVGTTDPATSAPSATLPGGPTLVPVERKPLDPPASTAARAPAEAPAEKPAAVKPPPAVAPTAVAPPALRPAGPAPGPAPRGGQREAGRTRCCNPHSRAADRSEDRKADGRKSLAFLVAPLDDIKRPVRRYADGAASLARTEAIRKGTPFQASLDFADQSRLVMRPSAGRRSAGSRCSRSPSPERRH